MTATRGPPKPTVASTEEDDLLKRSNKKSKMPISNTTDIIVEQEMCDANEDKSKSGVSFKYALLKSNANKVTNEEC